MASPSKNVKKELIADDNIQEFFTVDQFVQED